MTDLVIIAFMSFYNCDILRPPSELKGGGSMGSTQEQAKKTSMLLDIQSFLMCELFIG